MEMQAWQSGQVNELAAAIVKSQKEMKPATKDCTNPFFKSKYADLAAVWAALLPFTENGIAITQSPMEATNGHAAIETQLTHISGQWMRSRLTIPVAKDDPQGMGSAITYARRYALGCMTGLVTEEDDDGNAASKPALRKAAPALTQAAPALESPPVPATDSQMPMSGGDSPKFPFGAWKGRPLTEVPMGELQGAMDFINRTIDDPKKAKFRKSNEEMVFAIQEEMTRREEHLEMEGQ